jgi:hypothetical protein
MMGKQNGAGKRQKHNLKSKHVSWWSDEEDNALIDGEKRFGKKWTKIFEKNPSVWADGRKAKHLGVKTNDSRLLKTTPSCFASSTADTV